MTDQPTAYHGPIDIDARDSDRMELPDAPNASRWNVPMFFVPFLIVLVPCAAAAIWFALGG